MHIWLAVTDVGSSKSLWKTGITKKKSAMDFAFFFWHTNKFLLLSCFPWVFWCNHCRYREIVIVHGGKPETGRIARVCLTLLRGTLEGMWMVFDLWLWGCNWPTASASLLRSPLLIGTGSMFSTAEQDGCWGPFLGHRMGCFPGLAELSG